MIINYIVTKRTNAYLLRVSTCYTPLVGNPTVRKINKADFRRWPSQCSIYPWFLGQAEVAAMSAAFKCNRFTYDGTGYV